MTLPPLFFVVSGCNCMEVSWGVMIKLRFIAGMRFFCELLNVGYLMRLTGEGCVVRPKLPSSRPATVRRPPLEFVSKGVLFLRLT